MPPLLVNVCEVTNQHCTLTIDTPTSPANGKPALVPNSGEGESLGPDGPLPTLRIEQRLGDSQLKVHRRMMFIYIVIDVSIWSINSLTLKIKICSTWIKITSRKLLPSWICHIIGLNPNSCQSSEWVMEYLALRETQSADGLKSDKRDKHRRRKKSAIVHVSGK